MYIDKLKDYARHKSYIIAVENNLFIVDSEWDGMIWYATDGEEIAICKGRKAIRMPIEEMPLYFNKYIDLLQKYLTGTTKKKYDKRLEEEYKGLYEMIIWQRKDKRNIFKK